MAGEARSAEVDPGEGMKGAPNEICGIASNFNFSGQVEYLVNSLALCSAGSITFSLRLESNIS